MSTPTGHYIYEEIRDGERLTFSVCDNIPNTCPEFDPDSGELINIFFEDGGMRHMVTCAECIEKFQTHQEKSDDPATEGVRLP